MRMIEVSESEYKDYQKVQFGKDVDSTKIKGKDLVLVPAPDPAFERYCIFLKDDNDYNNYNKLVMLTACGPYTSLDKVKGIDKAGKVYKLYRLIPVNKSDYGKYGKQVWAGNGYQKNSDGIIVNIAGKGKDAKYVIAPVTDNQKTDIDIGVSLAYAKFNKGSGNGSDVQTVIGSGTLYKVV